MRYKKTLLLIPALLFISYKVLLSEALFLKAPSSNLYQTKEQSLSLSSLDTPFSFLGMGSQCLAFSSEDEKYVLKICRASRYQLPFFLDNPIASFLFPSYIAEKRISKAKKRVTDGSSYLTAYEKLQKQSGITFLHLDKTNNLKKKIKVIDPLGIPHFLSSDNILFYLQKKAIPLHEYIQILINNKNKDELKNLFTDLFNLVLEGCELGILMKDVHPGKNIGICNGKPMWIDPGRITEVSPLAQKETLRMFYDDIAPFILKMDPSLEEPLSSALSEL
jgi:hypothetical protein